MRNATKTLKKSDGWDDSLYLRAYEIAATGASDTKIRKALGVREPVWKGWIAKRPALREAIDRARRSCTGPPAAEHRGVGERFLDYCYKRMSPELQELWDQIRRWNGVDEDGADDHYQEAPDCYHRVTALFERPGMERARQALWIHALVAANFNANEACRKVCVSYTTVARWERDPKFQELVDQIERMKDAFAEGAMFDGIAKGDSALIMFALRGRLPGKYNPRSKVDVSGTVLHGHADMNELIAAMPLEAKKAALEAMRKAGQKALEPHLGEVIDAEVISGD